MNKIKIFLCLLVFSVSCIGNNLSSIEELNRRVAELEYNDKNFEEEVDLLYECAEWRATYIREALNCVNGLQKETLKELTDSEKEITENVINTRRGNACIFSCTYETQCKYTNKQVCALIKSGKK